MKKVRSSQPCISMNFCTEFSKAQVFPCEIVKYSLSTQVLKPLQPWCCFSVPPEGIRKPNGSLMFSGGIEKQHRAVMALSANFCSQMTYVPCQYTHAKLLYAV